MKIQINFQERTCRKCNNTLPITKYYKDKRFADAIDIHCSDCRKAKTAAWRNANPERAKDIQRKSRNRNPEAARQRARNWHEKNRERHLKYMADRRKNSPRKVISSKLKSVFGITIEEYDDMLQLQNGGCAICGALPSKRRLAVDHCHSSNKVRGLLCQNCNQGLGHFHDSITKMESAINYLKTHE